MKMKRIIKPTVVVRRRLCDGDWWRWRRPTDDRVALPSKGKFTFAVSLKWVRGHKSCTFLWLQSILKFDRIIRARTDPPHTQRHQRMEVRVFCSSREFLVVSIRWQKRKINARTISIVRRFPFCIRFIRFFEREFSFRHFRKVLWIWTAAAAASVDFIYWPCATSNKLISIELTKHRRRKYRSKSIIISFCMSAIQFGIARKTGISAGSQKRGTDASCRPRHFTIENDKIISTTKNYFVIHCNAKWGRCAANFLLSGFLQFLRFDSVPPFPRSCITIFLPFIFT